MTRTPWYPASVKPVRSGWYEVKISNCLRRRFWCGDGWLYAEFGGFTSFGTLPFHRPRPLARPD